MRKLVLLSLALLMTALPGLSACLPWLSPATIPSGGTLNLYNIDPFTLDPALAADATSSGYVQQIFSGLVRLEDDLAPAPDIAERWEVSNGGLTYTFFLRQDVTFHDGRKVTAGDFKYAWERAVDPRTGSQTASTYLGDIVGILDKLSGKASEISGVKVIGDHTLEVTLDAPKTYFLYKLAYPTSFVVDRNNVAGGAGWWQKPNGTGPFKLSQWQPRQQLVLVGNDGYYGEKAKLGRVVFKFLGGVPFDLYETGEIDVAGVSSAEIYKATDPAGAFLGELEVVSELSFGFIGFNHRQPPFDDVNVRRAFALAVDKEKLASLVFHGTAPVAHGILPPGIPGYDPNLKGESFDANRAKAYLEASRYGSAANLPPIVLTVSGWGGLVPGYLDALVVQWRENLGVEVTLRQLEPDFYFYSLRAEKDQMFDMGWIADYPHPQNFLDVLFGTGSESNFGEYANPAVDALLAQAALEPDEAKMISLYRQAEKTLVDDFACIPLWTGRSYLLVKPYVKGYEPNVLGFVRLERVEVVGR
ncbi:MAG: peptide ABC transporter substrate-binding protein [Dehalococcoidia bacterium]|nr:MAG: peptide ABC transporter substrate-binding protein [Dehalococcoidia bacterium]